MWSPAAPIAPCGGLLWRHRRGVFDLTEEGVVMGVLNVTPDSFSDGGEAFTVAQALARAQALEEAGAAIIDVGGESTRPGARPVPEAEELRRVVPVVRGIRERSTVVISIDTSKAAVADAALRAGADIVNDVTGFLGDAAMASVAMRHGAGAVVMHMRGTPATMQAAPCYEDVVAEVGNFLRQRIGALVASGMHAEAVAVDPGIGFGKTPEHNARLLAATASFAASGRPVLLGLSRKSFLGWLAGVPEMAARHWPGVALTAACRALGARIFRVHEPRPHLDAMRMIEAIAAGHD